MLIVGVTGYAQHGKDTLGARLVERFRFSRYAFADGVRESALAIDPLVRDTDGTYVRLSALVALRGWDKAKLVPEVRRLLQVIGTEGVRDIVGEDSWVNALARKLVADQPERVVITDVRFPNEARWVQERGGVLVRVQRVNADGSPFESGIPSTHPSEAQVPSLPFDRLVVNDSTPAYLGAVDAFAFELLADVEVTAHGDTERTFLRADGSTRTEPFEDWVTTEYEAEAARQGHALDAEYDGDWPRVVRYGYRRIDKMHDHEHLDAVRAAQEHYR